MTDPDPQEGIVPVEIFGRRYPVRSGLEAGYVAAVAAYVDDKMRAAADMTVSGDPLKLAVLAALNIADELFRCRERLQLEDSDLAERTVAIEHLLDQALGRLSPVEDDRGSQ